MNTSSLLNASAKVTALAALLLLVACTTTQEPETETPTPATPTHKTVVQFAASPWQDLPASTPQDWARALTALKQSCSRVGQQSLWKSPCAEAQNTPPSWAEAFFRKHFSPWRIAFTEQGVQQKTGLMTGYYEPQLNGSLQKTSRFKYPLYGVPDDLITVDLSSLYPQLKGLRLRGKLVGQKLVPYDDRATIDKRNDLGQKALVWVDDEIEAFFLQIQGSGRIRLPDGSVMRVGYADQNGHPYRSIGTWLIRNGELSSHEASMQGIQAWARRNPSKVKSVLAQNPSYVFFAPKSGDPALGPVGAQGVPLTPEASVAVDRSYWKLGAIFLVQATQQTPALSLTRPVVAQDTGGAIRGPIRFDYFWGFGDKAGQQAGRQKSQASAWLLVPHGYSPDIFLAHP